MNNPSLFHPTAPRRLTLDISRIQLLVHAQLGPWLRLALFGFCFVFHGLLRAEAEVKDVGPSTPNRTLPPHAQPTAELSLPDSPTEVHFRQVRIFAEPLVPVGRKPTAVENQQLAAALRLHGRRPSTDEFVHLEQFVRDHPDSPWTPSLQFNLGMDYFNTGYFSQSVPALEKAWASLKEATDTPAKALADRAAGELAMMYARLGQVSELSALLASVKDRSFVGPATEKIAGASHTLWTMEHQPGVAFRCGPVALDRIRAQRGPEFAGDKLVYHAHATTNGYSLGQLARLSLDLGMHYRMAHRATGAALLVPSVVHLKVGHYAALLKDEEGRCLVQDPTFGDGRWVTRRALEEEASGFFLIPPANDLPKGWREVNDGEAARVWGRGIITQPPDPPAPPDPTTKTNPPCPMAVSSVYLMQVSLLLKDSPVGYTPAVGPSVVFRTAYTQRESGQPALFTYSNLGSKWTFDWLAFIQDDPSSLSSDVKYYTDGGGMLPFTSFNPNTQAYASQAKRHALLKRTSSTSYEMIFSDGSKFIFGQPDSVGGTSRRVFMTAFTDKAGNMARISYDSSFRVVAITDAIGQVTTLSYQNADPLKITKVTDPFGRFATFDYDAQGRLTKITDIIGITSQFAYDSGDFIQALTTPYGATTFVKGGSVTSPWLETTHPNGEKERVEFNQSAALGIPNSEPASVVPSSVFTFNEYIYGRNTFYWDRKAYAEGAGDYTKAHIYHWLHNPDVTSVSAILESEKLPLENRVWYNYDGQGWAGAIGTTAQPKTIARVLDDGTTQTSTFQYNDLGHILSSVDPVGRRLTYLYATNLVDLLEVRQTTGTNNELLSRSLYNTQHLAIATWDAAGQMTTNTFHSRGQLLATVNPKGERTTYTYDTNGYRLAVDGPLPGTNDITSYTYDTMGRVQAVTRPDGYTLAYAYDNLNRLTKTTYPDGTFEANTYDKLDRVKTRDRMGRETITTYDALRHPISVQDPLGRITRYDYCGCGALSALFDPLGRRTAWEHDLQGRLITKQYADGSRVTYEYEKTTSRLKTITDEKGQVKLYAYSRDNNLTNVTYLNAQVATTAVNFAYDRNYNRRIAMQDGIGLTTWSYHPAGGLGALQVAAVDGPWANDTVTYQYDALGRVTSRAINGVAQLTTYDALGRATNVVNALGGFAYAYDGPTRRPLDVLYPNGQTTHYEYLDNLGDHRLQRITHRQPDSSLLSRFTYAYNPAGSITNWLQEMSVLTENWNVGYDAADQLLGVTADQGGTNTTRYGYNYDSAGNRLFEEINGARRTFSHNALNELTGSSDTNATSATYEWDAEHRLIAINQGTNRSEFYYDGLGRRARIVEKQNGSIVTNSSFLWCGAELCEARDATGTTIAGRYFQQGIQEAGGANWFYTRDHLGSIREATDANGGLNSRYKYAPYGQRTLIQEAMSIPSGFTGHYIHARSGNYLTLFRALDSGLGRWLSRDPEGEQHGVNLYAYVLNNPINKIDPFGLDDEDENANITGPGLRDTEVPLVKEPKCAKDVSDADDKETNT